MQTNDLTRMRYLAGGLAAGVDSVVCGAMVPTFSAPSKRTGEIQGWFSGSSTNAAHASDNHKGITPKPLDPQGGSTG